MIVQKCQGLPLTLEVLGCYLRDRKDSEIWRETIDKLGEAEAVQGGEEDRVWARLRISYDKKLSKEEQEMFIDTATFFFDQPLDRALVAWSTAYKTPHASWKNLLSTCLVKEKARPTRWSDGWSEGWHDSEIMSEVRVHEHLRDLAKKISKAEVSPMMDAVHNNTDSSRLWKGLRVRGYSKSKWLQLDLLDEMENLKYVEVKAPPRVCIKRFPRKLSLLRWADYIGEDSTDLPPINLEELSDLAILELSRVKVQIHHLPTNWGKLSRLKRLKLSYLSIRTLPDSFGELRALEYLQCEGLGLLKLPESFGSLSLLKHLTLRERSLKSLPNSFSKLLTLERLVIHSDCLEELGDSFGKLRALNKLEIMCEKLKTLPESFVQLSALRYLEIYVESLEKLPDRFESLSALEELRLSDGLRDPCKQLKTLPETFGELSALRILHIRSKRLEKLPDNFGRLSALEELKLDSCRQLQRLPDDFGELQALKTLYIEHADQLKVLPDNFRQLVALKTLVLHGEVAVQVMDVIETLGNFSSLEALEIWSCQTLETLPESVGHISSLRRVVLWCCPRLKNLPDSLGKPRLPQLAVPQQDSPVEYHAPKTTATEGVRLEVTRCPHLHASALQELGWVECKESWSQYKIFTNDRKIFTRESQKV